MKVLERPDSAQLRSVWAKHNRMTDESFPLYRHLEDTAAVASGLYETWFSRSQRESLAAAFGSEAHARRVAVWLGGVHDVGKCSAAFAMKVESEKSKMQDHGFVFPSPDPPKRDQQNFPHGLAGQLAVREYLTSKTAASPTSRQTVAKLAAIVGGHHGTFPQTLKAPLAFGAAEAPMWRENRVMLLSRADAFSELSDADWNDILSRAVPDQVQALLAGFVIMCDWLASHTSYFPYEDQRDPVRRAGAALARLSFGEHWKPNPPEQAAEYFEDHFGIGELRPVQSAAATLTSQCSEASLVLIEASTGEGKTEAALACAEILAEKTGVHGLFFALPTRATSNAMFRRIRDWLDASQDANSPVTIALSHSKAQFDDEFQSLFPDTYSAELYEEDEQDPRQSSVVAHRWFHGRDRNTFADFVVGTIDQLLFMTLKSKRLSMRHLGLSGKAVVIDEIHAADTFMQTYLLRALQWLGAYGVPVIALSATLPPALRAALLTAYRQGARFGRFGERIRPHDAPPQEIEHLSGARGYPLVTSIGAENSDQVVADTASREYSFQLDHELDPQLVSRVLDEAREGGCIAVIANTVDRAQDLYRQISAATSAQVMLLHSRFTLERRIAQEQRLVELLSPDGHQRPDSLIVVATQIIEASLDLDFDLMFTDIAPIDHLLQRMGRVHRHKRDAEARPRTMRHPRIILTGGEHFFDADHVPTFHPGTQHIYGQAKLLRTVAQLRALGDASGRIINVPKDVPSLIRGTYAPNFVPPAGWENTVEVAEQKYRDQEHEVRQRSQTFVIDPPSFRGISSWSELGYSEAKEEQLGAAQVRDAELSLEVVLIQQVQGRKRAVPWLTDYGGMEVDDLHGIEDSLAKAVATCTVQLPAWITRGSQLDAVLDELEAQGVDTWQRSGWLRGMLPLMLDEHLQATLNGFDVTYDTEFGLIIHRKNTVT